MSRVYNFSAGPAVLPEEVLREAAEEMLDYKGTGMSVMEMSHRSKAYDTIIKEAEADLRTLLKVPDNYKVLFLQGGASLIFASVPMNLMKNRKAGYILTGQWAKKAFAEAKIYGEAVELASSCFLSEPMDISAYGMVYAGVQKNVGPAGTQIVIIREDLLTDEVLPGTPTMMKYKVHADNDSLYNTPPCYGIYICGKVFKWLRKNGGLEAMKEINEKKAGILYDFLDESELFKGTVRKEDRSLMNVPFVTGSDELDAKFIKEATAAGFVNLKGHRTVGGMRASIYNAMPIEGVEKLVTFMKEFENNNR